MKVMLTGGGGFLGGRVVDALRAAGHQPVLLLRRPEAATDLPSDTQVIAGDVRDLDSVRRAMHGCDVALHAAAMVKRWAKDKREFDRVNVDGLANVIDAASSVGLSRVVYVSSFFALGPTDGRVGDEEHRHDGAPRNDYERTKWLADRLARDRIAAGAPVIVAYPGVVFGEGRVTDGNIMAQAARDLIRGKLPGTIGPGDRPWCLANVDDVSRGLVTMLERAPLGSRYLLGGENLTVRETLGIVASVAGVSVPRRVIPFGVAAWLGKLLRWRAELTGAEPILTDEEVAIYRHEWAFTSAKAQRELGYTITPAREALTAMTRWLMQQETQA
ncbi:MAG: NAD-dependent epimerase/dehydratase family protein [Acidobacteriota bacterium]